LVMERAGIKRLDVNDNAHNTNERVIDNASAGDETNEGHGREEVG